MIRNKAQRDMRKHPRRKAEFGVMLGTALGPKVAGDISLDAKDLSESGAFLRSELLFEEGEVLYIEIPLPSGRIVTATGRVARVNKDEGGDPGMGIEFVQLSDEDRKILSANLSKLMGAPR